MKSIFVRTILLAGIIMCFSVGNVQALPYSTMDLLNSSITVGDTFSVQVSMNRDTFNGELVAFGFDVNADTGSILSYTGYSLLGTGFDDYSTGENNVTGIIFPGVTSDNVLLATLTFTALNAGNDTLSVKGIYDGIFYGAFYVSEDTGYGYDIDSSMNINVTAAAAPVPEPATMLLLGTGLLGLAGFRKKLKA